MASKRRRSPDPNHLKFINYQLAPGEELVICKYDQSHRVRKNKIGSHELKCKRNHQNDLARKKEDAKLLQLDTMVRLHPDDDYLTKLNDMKPDDEETVSSSTDMDMNDCEKKVKKEKEKIKEITTLLYPMEENWDRYDYPTYDPKKKLESEVYTHVPAGMSWSQRRDFRKEQDRNYHDNLGKPKKDKNANKQ